MNERQRLTLMVSRIFLELYVFKLCNSNSAGFLVALINKTTLVRDFNGTLLQRFYSLLQIWKCCGLFFIVCHRGNRYPKKATAGWLLWHIIPPLQEVSKMSYLFFKACDVFSHVRKTVHITTQGYPKMTCGTSSNST